MRSPRVLLFAVVLVALSAAPASAHFSGNSWEYLSGPYIIDIGYDTDIFFSGSYTRFDFNLKDEATLDPRNFSEVWVRLVRGERATLFAAGIHRQPIGPTTLLYVFPEAGEYRLEASYRDASGNDIATTSFPIQVKSGPGGPLNPYLAAFAGMAMGALAAAAALRLFKKRPHA